jgi:hypothetical protein
MRKIWSLFGVVKGNDFKEVYDAISLPFENTIVDFK